MKASLRAGERVRSVRVLRRGDCLQVAFEDGGEFELRLLSSDDGRFELEHGHTRIHGAGARQGHQRQLWVNGHTLNYQRHQATAGNHAALTETPLTATIPSVVLDVLVRPGETVSAGQKLILLESMKMVVPILAPRDGTVRALHCRRGEAVAAGVPLLDLDDTAGS